MSTLKKILIVIATMLCVTACGQPNKDFATPEDTIHTYYRASENKDLALVNKCFFLEPRNFNFGSDEISMDSYQIKSKIKGNDPTKEQIEKREKLIAKLPSSRDPYAAQRIAAIPESGDIEIIVNNKLTIKDNKKFSHDTWYRLRRVKGEWKIVSLAGVGAP
jgi:DNA polymerase sigma